MVYPPTKHMKNNRYLFSTRYNSPNTIKGIATGINISEKASLTKISAK